MLSDSGTTDLFRMDGARAILERSPNAIQIKKQVEAIENAVNDGSAMAFDFAKTLIETTCKTILSDLSISIDKDWDVPGLLKETMNRVRLFPADQDAGKPIQDRFRKTVNGLNTAVTGLAEIRNNHGIAGHGQDAYEKGLEAIQAEFVARASDSVVSFLWNAHRTYPRAPLADRTRYEDYTEFNDWLDDSIEELSVLEFTYKGSEVLYKTDPKAYHEKLMVFINSRSSSKEMMEALRAKFGQWVRPDLVSVKFLHMDEVVYLKIVVEDGSGYFTTNHLDTDFVAGPEPDGVLFPVTKHAQDNADLFLKSFDSYSIINCFDIFTEEAAEEISTAYEEGRLESLIPPIVGEGETVNE